MGILKLRTYDEVTTNLGKNLERSQEELRKIVRSFENWAPELHGNTCVVETRTDRALTVLVSLQAIDTNTS